MGARRATQKRKKEAGEADRDRLLPFELEHHRIELGAGEERQDDRADAGEEFDPGLVGPEQRRADGGAEDQLRHGADHDFGQRGRDAEPDREEARDQSEAQPERRQCPYACHAFTSPSRAPLRSRTGRQQKPALRRVTHGLPPRLSR